MSSAAVFSALLVLGCAARKGERNGTSDAGGATAVDVPLCSGHDTRPPHYCERALSSGTDSSISPIFAMAGRIDADDLLDLAIVSSASNSPDVASSTVVTILRGRGDGSFDAALGPFAFGGRYPQLVDVNGDGLADVATGALVAFADAKGSLAPPVRMGGFNGVWLWGDLNRDGHVDSVFAHPDGIDAQLGSERGLSTTVRSAQQVSDLRYAALADVDGDTYVDLLGVHHEDPDAPRPAQLQVLLGDGQGGFGAPESRELPAGATQFVSADLNCDGRSDAICSTAEGNVEVWLRETDSWPTLPSTHVDLRGFELSSLATGDLNADNTLDLVVAAIGSNARVSSALSLSLGDGAGGFRLPRDELHSTEPPGSTQFRSNFVLAADFNRDGHADLVGIDPNPAVGPRFNFWLSCE